MDCLTRKKTERVNNEANFCHTHTYTQVIKVKLNTWYEMNFYFLYTYSILSTHRFFLMMALNDKYEAFCSTKIYWKQVPPRLTHDTKYFKERVKTYKKKLIISFINRDGAIFVCFLSFVIIYLIDSFRGPILSPGLSRVKKNARRTRARKNVRARVVRVG